VPHSASCTSKAARRNSRRSWIQAIVTTAPDLPPEPGVHATFARDHEYKRHGTLSLLAGIDLLTGKPQPRVRRVPQASRRGLSGPYCDQADPRQSSAHISKETKAWLAAQTSGRFEFTLFPKHGSWLNLVEAFFSKLPRSVLRHIRVASKRELKKRIMAAINDINQHPVVHTWTYKLDKAANSNLESDDLGTWAPRRWACSISHSRASISPLPHSPALEQFYTDAGA
jgi:DDE superfamily endonuclease